MAALRQPGDDFTHKATTDSVVLSDGRFDWELKHMPGPSDLHMHYAPSSVLLIAYYFAAYVASRHSLKECLLTFEHLFRNRSPESLTDTLHHRHIYRS